MSETNKRLAGEVDEVSSELTYGVEELKLAVGKIIVSLGSSDPMPTLDHVAVALNIVTDLTWELYALENQIIGELNGGTNVSN